MALKLKFGQSTKIKHICLLIRFKNAKCKSCNKTFYDDDVLIILFFPPQDTRNLNPTPYNAEYVGHKLHLDQNEKLGMFGVTHVLGVDGYSSKIVAHSTMPMKNNLVIYEEVYR